MSTRLYLILVLAAATLLPVGAKPVSAASKKAVKQALKKAVPLYDSRFTVPNTSADFAWERATEWVTLLSDMRLDVATNTVLQTYSSQDPASVLMSCQVNRRKDTEETVFTADCTINNLFSIAEAARGAAVLRRYIMTGEEACLVTGSHKLSVAECLVSCDGAACEPKEPELIFPEHTSASVENCTLEQITAMAKAGLSDEQIRAACGEE